MPPLRVSLPPPQMLQRVLCHRRITTAHDRIRATQKWLDTVVIHQKLCPFAPPVRNAPQLRIKVSNASDEHSVLQEVVAEAHILVGKNNPDEDVRKKGPPPETTLFVLNDDIFPEMSSFRSLVQLSWRLQAEAIDGEGFSSDVQIVLFHPLAKHDTYALLEDAADYTIRSPYPMIHLLREVDVMKAVQSGYKDLENLPSRNKAKLSRDGVEVCQGRLEACTHQGN